MIDGRCKEAFEAWYRLNCGYMPNEHFESTVLPEFYKLHPSKQHGVIVDFADSVGFRIVINYSAHVYFIASIQDYTKNFGDRLVFYENGHKTRQEARTAATEKFSEQFNELNK